MSLHRFARMHPCLHLEPTAARAREGSLRRLLMLQALPNVKEGFFQLAQSREIASDGAEDAATDGALPSSGAEDPAAADDVATDRSTPTKAQDGTRGNAAPNTTDAHAEAAGTGADHGVVRRPLLGNIPTRVHLPALQLPGVPLVTRPHMSSSSCTSASTELSEAHLSTQAPSVIASCRGRHGDGGGTRGSDSSRGRGPAADCRGEGAVASMSRTTALSKI